MYLSDNGISRSCPDARFQLGVRISSISSPKYCNLGYCRESGSHLWWCRLRGVGCRGCRTGVGGGGEIYLWGNRLTLAFPTSTIASDKCKITIFYLCCLWDSWHISCAVLRKSY